MAVVFWFTTSEDPVVAERRRTGGSRRSAWLEMEPLKNVQVWRFALYYFFVFGGFVALSLWLPQYLMNVYGVDLKTAGMTAAMFSLPASLFRAYGGHLSDRYGARTVMYWTFLVAVLLHLHPVLSADRLCRAHRAWREGLPYRNGAARLHRRRSSCSASSWPSARPPSTSTSRSIIPKNVGAVGGLVGMIGGLGGFVLPIAFGALFDLTGLWTSCFMLLFVLVSGALVWMHFSIRQMERSGAAPADRCKRCRSFRKCRASTSRSMSAPCRARCCRTGVRRTRTFWDKTGRAIARQNLWLSIPSLLLSFAIWQVWSVVVAKLPLVGFKFSTDQLFWLAALPGLTGATLRIFYSFMVPMFGGRLWTTLATWSLLIPAIGIGYAVQNPDTPYVVLLILALLCGFGGGNFASSMANISFFFPKAEKGNALALNAGLGNLGVSAVQFVAPLVIAMACSAALGGAPQTAARRTRRRQLWLQNAGFICVPFIALSAFAAWFGMNDIASAKASFAEQAVIFPRRHNWIMCVLYTGTFGSFIGYLRRLPAAEQDPVPAGRRAAIRLPRPAGRRAGAVGNRLGRRPLGRRARHARGVRRHDARRPRRDLLHRRQGPARRVLGLLRQLPVPVPDDRRRQRLDLPDDPRDHAQGDRAA